MKMKEAHTAPPMELDVRIYPNRGDGPAVATASVTLNDCFAIRDVRIMEGKNGLFVSMPSRKVNGEYRDVCFPCTKDFKQQFDQKVLNAYEQAQVQKAQKSPEPQEGQQEAREEVQEEAQEEAQEESGPNEAFSSVAGFVGDDTGLVDEDGFHLCVGDVVSLVYGNSVYTRMILLNSRGKPIFSQEELEAKKALRIDCFSEENLKSAASCACFDVTLHNCLDDATEQQQQDSLSMG